MLQNNYFYNVFNDIGFKNVIICMVLEPNNSKTLNFIMFLVT